MMAYIWIGILTATTYVFAGFMREQVCVYMCPWPRIQAALTDEWALNVTINTIAAKRGLAEEGQRIARARPAGRRLHRLLSMRRRYARPASISATARSSTASSAGCASMPATP